MSRIALSESRKLRFAVFTAYYFMQGLPIGLFIIALPAWFTANDIPKEQIASFIGIAGLPWALKLLAGPVIDKFNFFPMGLRRPWIIAMLLLMMLSSLGLLFVTDIKTQFWFLAGVCTAMSAFAAIEDVAVDGLAIAIIPEDERGRANAFMAGGQRVGMSITGVVAIQLLNTIGVPAIGLYILIAASVILVVTLLVPERPGERHFPWSDGESQVGEDVISGTAVQRTKTLIRSLVFPMSLLLICAAFIDTLSEGMLAVWRPQIAINQLSYTDAQYANWFSIFSFAAAIIAIAYGPVIDKFGACRAYRWVLLVYFGFFIIVFFSLNHWSSPYLVLGAFFFQLLGSSFLFITGIALAMSVCRVSIATTQFACYMAIFNLGRSTGSWVYPELVDFAGLTSIAAAIAAVTIIAWFLLGFFDLEKHKQHLARNKALQPKNRVIQNNNA
ncbi:MFS transporter [Pelagicoccus mobilis]|uniref:MFS transporter n=1 Tax=Pelagicoccus mobilis TaxID=415221 RepID=A0A934VMG7_9BACT|nr:MFS transporter [Pelagicoccus mobilis]MBK1878826.1 MFS transporter [Pelagicoccus mobilis]